ncbi:MAG: OmpA family protein [Sideroxydans sp.]|nr:OmpA family protein [Sideroxydans sp.]
MYKLFLMALLLIPGFAAQAEGNRPTDPADLEHIEQLQRKVDKLSFGPLGPNNYTLCKARAWLDMALIEYHENERTGIVQDGVEQAALLLNKLDADPKYIGLDTPHPYASEKVRQDLWDIADGLKQSGDMSCIGCKLAKLEVQLIWTGHDKWEAGWGHAEPFARIAENLAYEVQVDSARCRPAPPQPKGETIIIKKHTLITAVLFDFDLSLVTDAQQKLDDIIGQLKTWKQIDSIQLAGHADRLNEAGGTEYNQKLSQRRVDFVRDYLVQNGISAENMTVEAMGDTQPVVGCEKQRANKRDRSALIKCLQPNRRVDIIVEGVRGDVPKKAEKQTPKEEAKPAVPAADNPPVPVKKGKKGKKGKKKNKAK